MTAENGMKRNSSQGKYQGSEKRRHARTAFDFSNRPKLKIGLQEFDVIDISERGIGFVDDKEIGASGWVKGTVVFSDRRRVDVDGIIVRRESGHMGLHLLSPIK